MKEALSSAKLQSARSHRTPGNVSKEARTPGQVDFLGTLFSAEQKNGALSPRANLTDFEIGLITALGQASACC